VGGFPSDASVLAIDASSAVKFAGTDDGRVFRSTDDGANWTMVYAAPTHEPVGAIAVKGRIVFLSVLGEGVLRSADDGATWHAGNPGLRSFFVYAFAMSDTRVIAATLSGIFYSPDNGTSWISSNAHGLVVGLVVSGSTVFAAAYDRGVFCSTDGGASWVSLRDGLSARQTFSLVTDGSNLYAGTLGAGVWRHQLDVLF
jgi:photosystem II stability/assembly factor-like uncharacterized protein